MPSLLRRLTVPFAVAALLGCGTTDPSAGLLAISASNLTSGVPAIGWRGTLSNMTSVQLTTEADHTAILWKVSTPGTDGIAQPINYGDAPAGATVTGSSPALVHGTVYRVTVINTAGLGGTGTFTLP